jgi:hypothetical protein
VPAGRGNGSQQEQISEYLISHYYCLSTDRLEIARVEIRVLVAWPLEI